MTSSRKTADSSNYYDGVLSRPFLVEHWYRGFVAAILSLFLVALLLYTSLSFSFLLAVGLAGAFSLLLMIAVVTQHQRFELQLAQARYRNSLWVLGLRFGKWQTLPTIEKIYVRHRSHNHLLPLENNSPVSSGFVAIEDKWQVLLHVLDTPLNIVAAYVNRTQAVRNATILGAILNVEVVAAERN
jgi:hypothetical protein